MSSQAPEWDLFKKTVARRGDALVAAGIGLEGIGLMLAENELSGDELNALHHAVRALGAMVKSAGGDLFDKATRQEAGQ